MRQKPSSTNLPTDRDSSVPTELFNSQESLLTETLSTESASQETSSPQEKLSKSKQIKIAELELANVKVKVKTDATPSSLKQIRELVDDRFEQFAEKAVKGMSPHQMMLLATYSLAEELLKEREKTKVLKRKVNERLGRLLDRVESNLK
jgi:cell division protein ZapA (FtsZ GTPase activity inhibitor)